MSFSEDPFRVMTVVNLLDGKVYVHCDSCGGDSFRSRSAPMPTDFTLDTPVRTLREWMDWHARQSHALTPDDTRGWCVP